MASLLQHQLRTFHRSLFTAHHVYAHFVWTSPIFSVNVAAPVMEIFPDCFFSLLAMDAEALAATTACKLHTSTCTLPAVPPFHAPRKPPRHEQLPLQDLNRCWKPSLRSERAPHARATPLFRCPRILVRHVDSKKPSWTMGVSSRRSEWVNKCFGMVLASTGPCNTKQTRGGDATHSSSIEWMWMHCSSAHGEGDGIGWHSTAIEVFLGSAWQREGEGQRNIQKTRVHGTM